MTIAQNVASKLTVAFVAVAMIFMAIAPAVQAQETSEDLQKTINDLLAQVAALQAQTGGSTPAAGSCAAQFTMDLKTGSTGAEVMALQKFLNSDADTMVAATGAGSAGMETSYFGPATAAAVSKFQVKYRAEILSPAGLVNPTGFFGPGSRAQANKLCAGAPADDSDDEDEDTDEGDSELQGEGTLDEGETDLDDASDSDVMEGSEDAELGTLTLAAEDGDIEVARLTFQIVDEDATVVDGEVTVAGDNESDLWDTFETISLWVDGDMIGEFEADDEDNYLSEDDGTFRISGLDLVIAEDEEVEIVIAGTVMGSVDGADTEDWTVDVTDIRYFDADGVASDEEVDVTAVPVTIVEEGADDEATIESSSDNPDATTLKVDENGDESDEFDIFVFGIDVDEDSSDLVFNEEAFIDITVTNPDGTEIIADDVIDTVTLTIGGESVEGDEDDANIDDLINNDESVVITYSFDFEDVELPAGEETEATVSVTFKGQDGNYENGVIVSAAVDGADWEVEGLAGDTGVLTGDEASEDMTLATVVPEISGVESTTERNEATTAGTISFEFTVGADDDDVTLAVADNDDVQGDSDDVMFTLSGGAATSTATATLALVDGDAEYAAGVWTVNDGDEATFALDIAFDGADGAGTYRATLETVGGVEVDETSSGMVLVAS